ncbi:MAG: hypothetical protein HYY17_09720, partial [Planctomycetes bacterium]|nr:hypothetical protein [Planctomycetota bacterium]
GREMIVWGGTGDSTGGRYDPAADAWIAISTTGAPEPRTMHTAVWAGREMIVWGGGNVVTPYNNGGRYDPKTDTWTATGTSGAPQGRVWHTAVWSGREMIVWGGYVSPNSLATGGRYDPLADSWTPTLASGAPTERKLHTAVWTGRDMIVWGSVPDNTGGRYRFVDSQPPAVTPAVQLNSDDSALAVGATTATGTVVFKATTTDPDGDAWQLWVEVKPVGTALAFVPTATSGFVTSGSQAVATFAVPADGKYQWQYRFVDVNGAGTGWFEFGSNLFFEPDFVVDQIQEPPVVTSGSVGQFTMNGTAIPVGGATTLSQVILRAVATDPEGGEWRLEVECAPVGTAFSGAATSTSAWTASGTQAEVASPILAAGDYRWQYRLVDAAGAATAWTSFGGNAEGVRDFRVEPLSSTWSATGNFLSGRSAHAAVWTGREMIVWGGYNGTYLDTGGRYDPATDSWTATSSNGAPAGRSMHQAVWTGRTMVVWGGYDGGYLATGGKYDPVTDSWVATTSTNSPAGRDGFGCVWTGREMIVWGGSDGSFLNDGGRYDPALDTWTAVAMSGAPSARRRHAAVWTGREMIVWGGGDGGYLNDGGRYDPATNTWTALLSTGAPSPRQDAGAIWTGREMVVWGGYDGAYVGTGARFDPVSGAWTATSSAGAPAARHHHSFVWTGKFAIAWGGIGSSLFNDGRHYDPSADVWSQIDAPAGPSARYLHSTVWTGREMIVWGGFDGGSLDTGGRYAPAKWPLEAWSAVSGIAAPEGRYAHTAVWTGREMIVWGGTGAMALLAGGGRYDPMTDSWSATSSTDAPVARQDHVAVWTGREMIVWGGAGDGGAALDSGSRYDPVTDTWTALPAAGAERSLAQAVWTGREMIVWGGWDPAGYSAAGLRYDPASNGWTFTSVAGAPAGRLQHGCVWTGREMIVWGGFDGAYVATGGRYDPETDSWSPVASTGAPSARRGHAAVWTGREMIVWGGVPNTVAGGRYDPRTNTWTATSQSNVPSARMWHSAFWTGREMIVWGGGSPLGVFEVQYTNSGGRYDPLADTWIALTTAGAPYPRRRHTAVWTGREMIAWGGTVGSAPLGDGGRFGAGTPPESIASGMMTQHDTPGGSAQTPGYVDDDGEVTFQAVVADPDGQFVAIQVEVKPLGTPFDGITGVFTGNFVVSGSSSQATVSGLTDGAYHWRARATDGSNFSAAWTDFSAGTCFSVSIPVNAPPDAPSALTQHDTASSPSEPTGFVDDDGTVTFKATVSDPGGQAVAIQIEVKPFGSAFDGGAVVTGNYVSSGGVSLVTVSGLALGSWSWRARATDGSKVSDWTEFGGSDIDFVIGLNEPPALPSNPAQLKLDGATFLAQGATTGQNGFVLRALLSDPDGEPVRLQAEVRPAASPFTGIPTFTGDLGASQSFCDLAIAGVGNGSYHWRVRAMDARGAASGWIGDGSLTIAVSSNALPNVPGALAQFKLDGVTPIPWGGATSQNGVVISASVSDADLTAVALQVEVQPQGAAYTWSPTATVTVVSGATATVTVGGLADGSYQWRARAVDPSGAASVWSASVTFVVAAGPGSAPNVPWNLAQLKTDGATPVAPGAAASGSGVLLRATIGDLDGDLVRLQVEVRPSGTPFTGVASASGPWVASGSTVTLAWASWVEGTGYDWRARAVDANGHASAWVAFAGSPAFVAPANAAPNPPAGLGQFKTDGATSIALGGATNEAAATLKASAIDAGGDAVWIEFELKKSSDSFDGTWTLLSAGGSATVAGLSNQTGYRWRVRAVDLSGAATPWVEFDPAAVHFTVSIWTNTPPDLPASLAQWKLDGTTAIPQGGGTPESGATFSATVVDPDGGQVTLEVEVRPAAQSFLGVPVAMSAAAASGSTASVAVAGLAAGGYRWQARSRDANGAASAWTEFGQSGSDFVIGANLPPATPLSLAQQDAVTLASLPVGGAASGNAVLFSAFVTDPDGGFVTLQVEIKPIGQAFNGIPTIGGASAQSGTFAFASLGGLAAGAYRWQARAVDAGGTPGPWIAFGGNSTWDADFVIGGAPSGSDDSGGSGGGGCSGSVAGRTAPFSLAAILLAVLAIGAAPRGRTWGR